MKVLSLLSLLAPAVLAANLAYAEGPTVLPGAKAPALSIKKWLKGKEVKSVSKGVFVVEFWATWCGPCREAIPHITELAKKNKDVTFLGVGIWEDEVGDNLTKFVKDMGAKMDYNVGYSGNQEGMAVSWMQASGSNGIPTSFIVKDGVVQWIGHPMELEDQLKNVKAGKHDLAKTKEAFLKAAAEQEKQSRLYAQMTAIGVEWDGGKKADAKAKLEALIKENPDMAPQAQTMMDGWMAQDDPDGFDKMVDGRLAEKTPEKSMGLASLALQLSDKEATKGAAMKLMDKVSKAASDDIYVMYYATYLYNKEKAKDKAKQAAAQGLKLVAASKDENAKQLKKFFEEVANAK